MMFQKKLSYCGRLLLPRTIAALIIRRSTVHGCQRKKVPGISSRVGLRDAGVPCGTTFGLPT
jgi:hypothetical protein